MDLKRKLDYILKDERKREYTQNNSYKIMEFLQNIKNILARESKI